MAAGWWVLSLCGFWVLLISATASQERTTYVANWTSLDKRPLPAWYDEAKIGIFIHWGVFSVPSFGSEWFWHSWKDPKSKDKKIFEDFMTKNYPPGFTYQEFARDFTAQFFDPEQWAELFASSGAQYVVLTSKHHEGYHLWPSKYSYSWNSMDVGPHRDLIGELAAAIRNTTKLRFGLYHSLFEWYNPLWLQDFHNLFTTQHFSREKILPEMQELVEQYQPEVFWSDGEWDAPDLYWGSKNFLAWLYNESPVRDTVVVNDRWGIGTLCLHGDFYTCSDRFNPGVLQKHKWENAMTIDRESWGYRRNAKLEDYLTFAELVREVISTVSCGGNILINIGPTRDGIIAPIFEERLRQLGSWLHVAGEAVYGSRPWTFQNETLQTGVWYTRRDRFVYATILDWPKANLLTLRRTEVGKGNQVTLLGFDGTIKWNTAGVGMVIVMPDISRVGKVPQPWVFKFSNITN